MAQTACLSIVWKFRAEGGLESSRFLHSVDKDISSSGAKVELVWESLAIIGYVQVAIIASIYQLGPFILLRHGAIKITTTTTRDL